MLSIPLLLTVYAGFTHAFEADHLLAVSNIVSQRDNVRMSVKDGISWGLGHASTIFCIGLLMIFFKAAISTGTFQYFEAVVGFMLIVLAMYRLIKFFSAKKIFAHAADTHNELQQQHTHANTGNNRTKAHGLAYGVGLVHGLAGSGGLILIIMSQIKGSVDGLIYLLIFGFGGILGMMLASGLFSVPFSKKIMLAPALQTLLIIVSSMLCLLYGGKLIHENLLA